MATQKFLDQNGLQTFWEKIKTTIADQVSAIQGDVVLKTGAQTMAGPLTSTNGFVGSLTGKADTAGTADKTKASLTINVINTAGTTTTTTFNGSGAKTTTIDMSTLATDAKLNTAIESLGNEIDARIASVTADGTLITATTSADKKVTIGPATKLTTAVGLAENAVRSVTEGSTNGYIAVNTGGTATGVKVHGINTAAYKAESYFVPATTYNTGISAAYAGVTANAGEIADIKNAIAGGTHFIGISTTAITNGGTEKPTIGGSQKTVTNGDIVIYENKEFIWNGSAWAELGDTTAESNRITALEKWKTDASATISSNSAGVTANAGEIATIKNTITDLSNSVVKSFGGKKGAITVNTEASTITAGTTAGNGKATVDFAMSNNNLTAEVALPSQIWINKAKIESLTTSHNSLSGTVNTLSGTVNDINSKYASKAAAIGSITTSSAVSSGATVSIAATGNITTWTITPKNVNGTALTTAKITIESIPDSWINALS